MASPCLRRSNGGLVTALALRVALTGREGADRVRAHSQALETSLGNLDILPMAADSQRPDHMDPRRSFQGLILTLQRYWADYGDRKSVV